MVEVIRAVSVEALPALLDALDRARVAGVANATLAAAEVETGVRTAADLALFNEVAVVAGNRLARWATPLKDSIAARDIDVGKIQAAFALAERAGVTQDELDAARLALDVEMRSRLLAAEAVVQANTSAASMEDLALTIHVSRKLGFNEAQLVDAVQVFENKLVGPFTAADLDWIEHAVRFADHASARIPPELQGWAAALRAVREAAALPNQTESLQGLLAAVCQSRAANLPRGTELLAVEASAQAMVAEHMNTTLLRGPDEPAGAYVDRLVKAVEDSTQAGVAADVLALATFTARETAAAELAMVQALAGNLSDVDRVNNAFSSAALVGIPDENRTAARTALHATIKGRLAAARAAAVANRSISSIEALAYAIEFAWEIGLDPAELSLAREAFESQLQGPFSAEDVSFVEQAVRLGDHAHAMVPGELRGWPAALDAVRYASGLPAEELARLPEFLAAMRRAQEVGLPRMPELATVERKARACAGAKLNETLATPGSLGGLLEALEAAREAGVPDDQLAAAAGQAQAAASALMRTATNASLSDQGPINEAFALAARADVNSSDTAEARGAVSSRVQAQLSAALAAVGANRSAETIQQLGEAIHVGRKLDLGAAELEAARQVYLQQLEGPFNSTADVPFVERAVAFADQAGVPVPQELASWAAAAKKLREAANAPTGGQSIDQLVEAISESQVAGLPPSQELAAVQSMVQDQAVAELEQAKSPDTMALISGALDSAVGAGVPQTALDAAQTVLDAQASLL